MMQPRYLESFVLNEIDGQDVNRFGEEHPLNRQFVQRLMAQCPVAIVWPNEAERFLPYNDSVPELHADAPYLLEHPSDSHGRSFQIFGEDIPSAFEDEHGNTYHAVNLKGNNFRNPHIFESSTSAEGYLPYGLQESVVTARVMRASHILASRGISTEYVFGLAEPKMLPWPVVAPGVDASELVTRGVFKQRLIEEYLARLPDDQLESELTKHVKDTISRMGFYVSLRATDSPHRLADMIHGDQRSQVFEFINTNLLKPGQEPLDPNTADDVARYVTEFIAPKAGENLGRMHPDLAHGYLNGLNITALSGFVDLDSVRGEGLDMGDAPVTFEDRGRDVISALCAMSDIYYVGYENALAIQKPDINPHNIFLNRYFEKMKELLPSEEAYLDYKVNICAEISAHADPYSDSIQHQALCDLSEELRQELAAEYLRFLGLGQKQASARVSAEVQSLTNADCKPMLEAIAAEFNAGLEYYVPTCVREYLNVSVTAERAGEEVNPFKAFYESPDRERTETWGEMLDEIQCLYETAMAIRIAGCDGIKELLPHEMLRNLVVYNIFCRAGEAAREDGHISNLLASLLKHYEDQFEAAMLFAIPESHFPGADSFIDTHAGNNMIKSYWRGTEQVPVDDAMDFIGRGGGTISLEELTFTHSRRMISIAPSRPDAVIEEVVYDVGGDGNTMSEDSDTVDICFTDEPGYVLIIERLQDGSYHYRMLENPANLVTVEAIVINEDADNDRKPYEQLPFDTL